jgi:hypothetical protein
VSVGAFGHMKSVNALEMANLEGAAGLVMKSA